HDPEPLAACLSSFVFDFATRTKVGGTHLKFFTIFQTRMLEPWKFDKEENWTGGSSVHLWIASRVRYLRREWSDPSSRTQIRAELDAASFRLYGVSRDDVEYIMDTFPIVRRKDLAIHGEYRTKRIILETYD